jgi:DNA-binding response OmpR family regulator
MEDDPFVLETIKDCFNLEDYKFWVTDNETELIRLIEDGNIQVIIMDIGLPERTGLEIIQNLQSKCSSLPPIIIITGYIDEEHRNIAMKLGVSGYITKNPFCCCKVKDEIEKAIQ